MGPMNAGTSYPYIHVQEMRGSGASHSNPAGVTPTKNPAFSGGSVAQPGFEPRSSEPESDILAVILLGNGSANI